jgi:hypothetical protein
MLGREKVTPEADKELRDDLAGLTSFRVSRFRLSRRKKKQAGRLTSFPKINGAGGQSNSPKKSSRS